MRRRIRYAGHSLHFQAVKSRRRFGLRLTAAEAGLGGRAEERQIQNEKEEKRERGVWVRLGNSMQWTEQRVACAHVTNFTPCTIRSTEQYPVTLYILITRLRNTLIEHCR